MFGLLLGFFLVTMALGALGLWIFALVEIIRSEFKSDTDKIIWFLIVFFFPFVGSIIYFFAERNKLNIPIDDENEYV